MSLLSLVMASGLAAATPASPATTQTDAVLDALVSEAGRATQSLKDQPDAPLYYLSYRVRDGVYFDMSASFGALDTGDVDDDPLSHRSRMLDVSARVGSAKLDNTHRMRGNSGNAGGEFRMTTLPLEDDPEALRLSVWRATDRAYKTAAKQLIRVRANKAVKVEEEDDADDFAPTAAQVHVDPVETVSIDRKGWKQRLEKLSAKFKDHPYVFRSGISLQGASWTSWFVDNTGARIRDSQSFARMMLYGSVKADDGMDLSLYRDFAALTPDKLPSDAELEVQIKELIAQLEALRTAPVIEPYSGPAIITNRAAGVFFHEIFGHRVEGHRQKDADEGHTFTHKIGQPVVPAFISVVDDPTRTTFGPTVLNGHYLYDEEGVAAQSATLVEKGILKGFLMSKSPIHGFPASNGHGRAQAGLPPVARQGNLIVSSTNQVPYAELRKALIAEVKRQGKPYGLVFEDISGGFTLTRAGPLPQAFKVLPLVVKRVYTDGRPDELVRGVDMVGTPLQSFEKILETGDDFAVFNGFCGAESGYVPVSAVAPSLLVGAIEVERKTKNQDRPPLLPPPLYPDMPWTLPPSQAAAAGGAAARSVR